MTARYNVILTVILLSFAHLYAHNNLGSEHEKHLHQTIKGEHNSHPGWIPRDTRHSGGPDSFGYVFIDSNEPEGPQFNYINFDGEIITDMGDDDYRGPIQLPFEFLYYDELEPHLIWLLKTNLAYVTDNPVHIVAFFMKVKK